MGSSESKLVKVTVVRDINNTNRKDIYQWMWISLLFNFSERYEEIMSFRD